MIYVTLKITPHLGETQREYRVWRGDETSKEDLAFVAKLLSISIVELEWALENHGKCEVDPYTAYAIDDEGYIDRPIRL